MKPFKKKNTEKKVAKTKTGKFFSKPWVRKILKWLKIFLIVFFSSSIFFTILYRFVDPPVTPLMLLRAVEMKWDGKEMKLEKEWVDLRDMSPNMLMAVVSTEDQKFFQHSGFDFDAIEKALVNNTKDNVKVVKGGSTISQQTAKNVFLWPSRDWLRKGLETWFTFLIELFWSKERILEVYLNVIEFGEGVYGVEAASQKYYNKNAKKLTRQEAASLAVILPAPLRWSPVKPSSFLRKKINWALKQMHRFESVSRKACEDKEKVKK